MFFGHVFLKDISFVDIHFAKIAFDTIVAVASTLQVTVVFL